MKWPSHELEILEAKFYVIVTDVLMSVLNYQDKSLNFEF